VTWTHQSPNNKKIKKINKKQTNMLSKIMTWTHVTHQQSDKLPIKKKIKNNNNNKIAPTWRGRTLSLLIMPF
jgi:hypothetical protein